MTNATVATARRAKSTPAKRSPAKTRTIKTDGITYKEPGNGLPKWVKEAAATRGYGDALEPISLFVTDADITAAFECAAQGNGSRCVMAQAGKRLGATSVYFYRTTAWVDFGKGPIVRFRTSKSIYDNVITPFDKGDQVSVIGGMYPLTPPSPSNSLKQRRTYNKRPGVDTKPGDRRKKPVAHTDRVVMASQA